MDEYHVTLANNHELIVYRSVAVTLESNMFVIIGKGGNAIVVDSNEDANLFSLLRNEGIRHIYIILTHEHYDHIWGVNWLRENFDTTLICNRSLSDALASRRSCSPQLVEFVLAMRDKEDGGHRYQDFKRSYHPVQLKADVVYDTPCEFDLAGLHFRGVQTPGHSQGSWCLELDNSVFTGDSLLRDNETILRFPESDKMLYDSVTLPYLRSLPKGTMIFPGHGDPFKIEESKYL